MEIFQAIVLGIIEGLTEFLPISSTGHLIVAEDMMDYHDASKLFTIVIQMGAIAAVMWFYRARLWQLVKGLFNDNQIRQFWLIWVLATIPAGIAGLFLEEQLEIYANTATVAGALILGGIAILLIEKYVKVPESKKEPRFNTINVIQALSIGFYQILALIPGISRSGATIMGGLVTGLDRVTATAFSFFLSIPIILAAGIYKLSTGEISGVEGGGPAVAAGTIAAFATALAVISWLLRYVSRHDFKLFAYYRIIFGILLFGLLALGVLG